MGLYKRFLTSKNGQKRAYWYVRYSQSGREHKKSLGPCNLVSKRMAEAQWEEIRRKIQLSKLGIEEVTIPTLEEFSREYITYVRNVKKNRAWERDRESLKQLLRFFARKKLNEITPADISAYQTQRLNETNHLKRLNSPATVNRELTCLKALYNIAKQKEKFFGDNPVSRVKFLPEHNQMERILTDEEEKRLMSVCPPYLRAIIQTVLHTGLRRSEVVSLKWENIDFENGYIFIEKGFVKTKKNKRVPINSELKTILLEQKLYSGHQPYVFLHSRGEKYTNAAALYHRYKRACRDAGVPDLRFHDLRHTAATRMIEAGVALADVSKILGHSSLNMSMRYYHPDEALREAVEKLAERHKTPSKNPAKASVSHTND